MKAFRLGQKCYRHRELRDADTVFCSARDHCAECAAEGDSVRMRPVIRPWLSMERDHHKDLELVATTVSALGRQSARALLATHEPHPPLVH